MLLKYKKPDGTPAEFPLTKQPITIGRSPEADITLEDDRASRTHCGIRFEDGAYHLRDLKSKNGTYLNNERIDSAVLQEGDRFRIGAVVFTVEAQPTKGHDTAVQEVQDEMADGKGYGTILREIVDEVEEPPRGGPPRRA